MKYSKEFETLLRDSTFPEEWKRSAIEYRQLKKLIKNVVDELSEMGLDPDMLHRMMKPEEENAEGEAHVDAPESDDDELEFEFDSESKPSSPVKGTTTLVESPSLAARSSSPMERPRRFRVRLLSDDPAVHPGRNSWRTAYGDSNGPDELGHDTDHEYSHSPKHDRLPPRRAISSAARVKAEYVLSGPSHNPTPQIRLVLSASSSPSRSSMLEREGTSPARHSEVVERGMPRSLDRTNAGGLAGHPRFPVVFGSEDDSNSTPNLSEEGGLGTLPPATVRLTPDSPVPQSPTLRRVMNVSSPIWAITSGSGEGMEGLQSDLDDLALGDAALPDETDDPDQLGRRELEYLTSTEDSAAISNPDQETHTSREIIVPLPSDVAFFQLLTQALNSLSELHSSQQILFNESVAALCKLISSSITPSTGGGGRNALKSLAISHHKGKGKPIASPDMPKGALSYSKSDLYAWREIFTLWIEAQIFESSSERDRGERSLDQAEMRLKAFAAEVVKRGLGDRRTLRRKESREAWEEFLRLNVLLLDLKRFQLANIAAARKILKKHDKRTALTASVGFPQFVRKSLKSHVNSEGKLFTWTFYNTSLPHILLASLTETLLPILPSLEDYTCLICTSIAFKPIRLSCSHLFCVRCLAKMQRAGKAECPLCRSKTVLQADKHSLDSALMGYMIEWFPLEVKEKQKSNEHEVAQQEAEAMGLSSGGGQCRVQ